MMVDAGAESGCVSMVFDSLHGARTWLKEYGYSCGQVQAGAPVAVFKGDVIVAKWRNLSEADRAAADGIITKETS